jgi:carbohydrate kinase (thermoresistant glucokinase family)
MLAKQLGWPFADADDYHPTANVEKMRAGFPLTDADRQGWLETLAGQISRQNRAKENLVLACSALKRRYRDLLGVDQRDVVTVYLRGDMPTLRQRLAGRSHQYMHDKLLASQVATMEEPEDGLILDIGRSPEALVEAICRWLSAIKTTFG